MRRLDIWFLFCVGMVLALPSAGLAWKSARMFSTGALSTPAPDGGAQGWAAGADVFIATNHGFRKDMLEFHRDIRNLMSGQSERVLHGSDGWLFLTDSDVISQATGQRVDTNGVQRFVEIAIALADEARGAGRQFVVAIAPNKHTIYREKLPQWARAVPDRTEMDVLMAALARAGIDAVDLRPALLQRAASRPVYYRGDTHWTELGAVIAFNEIVRALGFEDQAVAIDGGFGPDVVRERVGDLVSLAKITGPWSEIVPVPRDGTFVPDEALERRPIKTVAKNEFYSLVRRGRSTPSTEPSVLVVGDSFTARLFGPLFMRFASEYVWIHNLGGAIDMQLIGERDPDIVVFEIVERWIPFLKFRPANAAPRS